MTDEEIERFALVLKECERIRALIAREEAALSNGEHDHGIPVAAAPQSNRRPCSSPRNFASPRRVLLGGDEGRTHVLEHEQRGLSLVVGGYASTATLGGTKEGRAHRLPVERVGDLDVLWACLSPASLEERQHLYEDCA